MSLNGALNSAFSGLRANARAATLVSTNIANATTEGYGRRVLNVSPEVVGSYGGVKINGVSRIVDPAIISDRRISDAATGENDTRYNFSKSLETAFGVAGDPGSLQDMMTRFENALLTASTNPASKQRLDGVAFAADQLATKLNSLSARVQQERKDADSQIALQVQRLNDALAQVDALNVDVKKASVRGGDLSSLLDERQRVIDSISEIVPIRSVPRENGEVALFTTKGGTLLDGRPSEFGFTASNTMSPNISLAAGSLSGLTVNGRPANLAFYDGGTLAANFEIRDTLAPQSQAKLDGVARDLIERLGPGGPDATLSLGDPGFFTDAGAAFDPINEEGISSRISLNMALQPSNGETWRIRDGINALTQGEVGNGQLILDLSAALERRNPPSSAALDTVSRTVAQQMTELTAGVSADRVRIENQKAFLVTQNMALKEIEFSKAVDTDQELQILLEIEQNYAANARVMTAVDEMLQRLLNI
ncbi:flagellar hook-associated protein FlgK [Cognatishimia sp. F0-27]|uniref:flagellar hook-associated protein FlgK n=1 Tax=Cognatishimia sp. F0-27 TaxID=2816855 RepID=UPI001D0C3112|nr:flagellar hook-associated protein FlgK [Cognatishimia sp. F0-27]MCC1492390.1 flagellar hook-associated protein FlgK [Cognatishimia sp. F0-27]